MRRTVTSAFRAKAGVTMRLDGQEITSVSFSIALLATMLCPDETMQRLRISVNLYRPERA